MFDPRNGLLLYHELEAALDKVQLAIVPMDEHHPDATNLKVVVFDKSILKKTTSEIPWKDLDNRPLVFKNANRPRLRYLYFSFVMNLFRRRRYECAGWRNDYFQYVKGAMWGSPGGLVRGSTLRTLARRVGHEPDLEAFLETTDLPLISDEDSHVDDELVADEVADALEEHCRLRDAEVEARLLR